VEGPRGIHRDCGCGQPVMFSLRVAGTIDGDPRMYTQGVITHIQFRGHPAQRFVYSQHFKVVGRFPDNVLVVADAMEETLRYLLRQTGCLSTYSKTTKRGGWAS
jgi:hypothetical protein